jgi:hypothetical protein
MKQVLDAFLRDPYATVVTIVYMEMMNNFVQQIEQLQFMVAFVPSQHMGVSMSKVTYVYIVRASHHGK